MELKSSNNFCLTKKLTVSLILLAFFACPKSIANEDFTRFILSQPSSIKLSSPINLETKHSQTLNNDGNTIIPFNLRGDFDEADYFTSNIEEEPTKNITQFPSFTNLPSPSEYKKPESKIEVAKSTIIEPTCDIFETSIANKDFNLSDDNIEGKLISSISINGLNSISEDIILNKINTQEGEYFNTETVQKDLESIYSIGFFSDNMSVEPTINADGTVNLNFELEENILVKDVSLIGNAVISTVELKPFISNLQGRPQNLQSINNSINNIQDYYHQKGYILANVYSVDDDSEGNLKFSIHEGIINKINISGNERTKDYIIQRNIITQPGSVYNEEFLKKDLAKVFSTQIFDEVNRDIKPSEENEGTYDVTIVVREKTTNSIGFGGGIDTGLGAFGSISLREDNFMGKAQKLSLSGILGSGILLNDASIKNRMNYQAELNFFEPHFLNADNSLMAKLYFREMGSWNIPLAIEQRVGLRAGVEHKVQGYENLTTSFTTGIEHIDLKEGDYNKISQLFNKHGLDISERAKQLTGGFFFHLTPGIKYSSVDNIELPREGIIAQAQFNEAIGISNINHTNGRLSGAVTKFFPVFKKSTFSLTGKAGIKVHGDNMPEIMTYRLGGPYSIRGFKMHGVGSGDSFVMGSAELATPLPYSDKVKWDFIKKMRITFFVDAGKVFDPTVSNVLYDRPLYALTAGVGLKFYIPGIGPMSIDYGLPLLNPGDYGSRGGYFTFGAGGMNGLYGY